MNPPVGSHTKRILRLVYALLLAVSLPVAAHGIDPLERVPSAPAAGAALEQLTGEVRELVVIDRVSGATVSYRWLALRDGTALRLRGDAAERLAKGSDVDVVGRRNGTTLFVTEAWPARAPVPKAARAAGAEREAVGELRLIHVDYLEEARSRFEYEVVDSDGRVTPVDFGIAPEALDRGMRVRVRGPARTDGTIEAESVEITALPRAETERRALAKAAVTNNVLVILIRFADSGAQPFTQAQVQATFNGGAGTASVAEFFRENSYGQQRMSATVTPWLASASATPPNCDFRTMGSLARSAATSAGYNVGAYQNLVYVFPRVAACGWSGLAYVSGNGVWSNGSNSLLVYAHELGHNFGLLHAGSLDCGAAVVGGACAASEYGDPFNAMGNQRAMHFNAAQKAILGWLGTGAVATHAGGSGTYTLSPLEAAGGTTYAIKVRAAANRTYWLEYRQPIGFDAALASYPTNGAQVRVAAPLETLCGACDSRSNDTQILDTTPSSASFTDAALVAGRSYTDTTYGITFNVLSAEPGALSVQVVSGGSLATTTTALSSSRNPAAAGTSVTFTATVAGASPTGAVAFTANGSTIGGCSGVALAGTGNTRSAACTTSALVSGSHAIAARYAGDATNAASTSATLTQVVNAPAPSGSNVALASAGATATASSTFSTGTPASSAINNERAGANWGSGTGGWKDGTAGAWPDWLQVNFAALTTIDRVVVYSVQDNWTNPIQPTDTMTFSRYGLRDFSVQAWNGSSWVTLASVTGNTLVKRTVTFPAYATDRIRIHATGAPDGYARITEVEAWGTAASPPSASNVALAAAGATTSASSTLAAGYAVSSIINGELTGANWGSGTAGWKDATPDVWPDWVEVNFGTRRTIDRVVLFSVQDNYTSPVQPTDTMTFTRYGIRDFNVQAWNGTSWVTLATVAGNNLVKRTVVFPAYATDRIRVNVGYGLANYSRITELQAWGS